MARHQAQLAVRKATPTRTHQEADPKTRAEMSATTPVAPDTEASVTQTRNGSDLEAPGWDLFCLMP